MPVGASHRRGGRGGGLLADVPRAHRSRAGPRDRRRGDHYRLHRGGLTDDSTRGVEAMLSWPGNRHAELDGLRTLIVGAGEAGRTLARALRRSPSYGLSPIGFLDDAFGLTRAAGLPVYRPIQVLPEVARAHRAEACIVAIPSLPAPYLPSFLAAVERDARISDLRQLRVESLLGRRELHVVSEKAAALISGKRVLVTGAGGSIGSELCRQIQGFGPAVLYLLDHDESNLHRLQ